MSKDIKQVLVGSALFIIFLFCSALIDPYTHINFDFSEKHESVCYVCNRSFTDSENKKSIAKTGMCKNDYQNFQFGQSIFNRN